MEETRNENGPSRMILLLSNQVNQLTNYFTLKIIYCKLKKKKKKRQRVIIQMNIVF